MSVSEDRTVQPSAPVIPQSPRRPGPARARRLCPHHVPAVRRQRQLDDAMPPAPRSSAMPSPTAGSPSCWPVCGSSATGTCSARPAFSHLRRLLDRPRPVGAARREPGGGRRQAPSRWRPRSRRSTTTSAGSCSAFAVVNTYLLILSTQVNVAVFLVFLTLEVTEIVLAIGQFNAAPAALASATIKVGGYVGVLTAIVAWYTSAAGVARRHGRQAQVPRGAGAGQVRRS